MKSIQLQIVVLAIACAIAVAYVQTRIAGLVRPTGELIFLLRRCVTWANSSLTYRLRRVPSRRYP